MEVFSGTRQGIVECPGVAVPQSAIPWPSKNTRLEILQGRLELRDCDNFVLSDRLAHRGDEFIMWCLERAIPSAKLRVNCELDFTPQKVAQR